MPLFKRLFLFLVFLLVVMTGTVIFLYFQNQKLKSDYLKFYTISSQQAVILDSMRRTGIIETMSSTMSRLEEELKVNQHRALTNERISTIAALTYSLKPYNIVIEDSIGQQKLSPERGDLLLMLTGLNIDSISMEKIMIKSSFSNALLNNANLEKAFLRGAVLNDAQLRDATLGHADLSDSSLKNAKLWGSDLTKAKLNGADLTNADLQWTVLNGAELRRAKLNGAEMTSSQLRQANISQAELEWTVLTAAFLNNADLTESNLFRTKLNRANLTNVNFTNANLSLADLIESNLTGAIFARADMSGAELNGALVSDKNWFEMLQKWNVKGVDDIIKKYQLIEEDAGGYLQYRLEKIVAK